MPDQLMTDVTRARSGPNLTRMLGDGLTRFSALLILICLVIVFGVTLQGIFLSTTNVRSILVGQAIPAMLALGVMIPIAAGMFDLSIAATMGLSATLVVWTDTHGHSTTIAIATAIAAGVFVGLANSLVIVTLGVDPFIATLGMGSILGSAGYWITNGEQIVGGAGSALGDFSVGRTLGVPNPTVCLLAVALVLIVFFRYFPAGRFMFAVGGNSRAANLAGVPTGQVKVMALVMGSMVASIAGVLLAGKLNIATPDMAAPYLIPAFTAVLLGATQVTPGRVNVLGSLIAVSVLATGINGLQLHGAPQYVNGLFNGAALIIAVAFAVRSGARLGRRS